MRQNDFDALWEAERQARLALASGCSDDLATGDRFSVRPAEAAREQLRAQLLSVGEVDAEFRKQLIAQAAESAAAECARRVFSNADVRFRARFRFYADALFDALLQAHCRRPRRIAVPHVLLEDERSIVPQIEVRYDALEEWTIELKTTHDRDAHLVCQACTQDLRATRSC